MFGSDWRALVKTGLVLAFIAVILGSGYYSWHYFSSYQKRHANERVSASEYEAATTQKSPDTCLPIMAESGMVAWFTCLADAVSADGNAKKADYDLNAQQDMAEWALGMFIVTVWLTVITLVGVYFVWHTLKATRDMARIELEPFLTVEVEPFEGELRKGGFFDKDGKPVTELWFRLKNGGKSAVVLERACRKWAVCPGGTYPDPVPYASPSDGENVKDCNIPIGGGSESAPIRCMLEFSKGIENWTDGNVYFHGFLRCVDLNGDTYVHGFCILYKVERFHLVWPPKNPERYNYRCKL